MIFEKKDAGMILADGSLGRTSCLFVADWCRAPPKPSPTRHGISLCGWGTSF